MQKLGPNHGFEARRLQENSLHPSQMVDGVEKPIRAWDISAASLKTLAVNNDEVVDKLAELEGRLNRLPFPFASSS